MKRDISHILHEWPFSPGQISARTIDGADGELYIQVRLDLGIVQMYAEGRPDGKEPQGFESLLEYFESQLEPEGPIDRTMPGDAEAGEEGTTPQRPPRPSRPTHGQRAPEDAADIGKEDPTNDPTNDAANNDEGTSDAAGASPADAHETLSGEDCRSLREEAAQYYQRYVACLVLDDFDRVIRDTTRNLRVLDLCAKHAGSEHDRHVLEQFRPYIIMIRARALASQAMRESEGKAAVVALDEAVETLRTYFDASGRPGDFEDSGEVQMLREMRDALAPKPAVSQASELTQRLQRAVEAENYELAAILRDELKQLREPGPGEPPTQKKPPHA